jgi:hypothetical protein
LVLAFTGIGSLFAALLGVVALIDIAQHRNRVTGTGYAIFGIVVGVLATGLFAFAVSRQELIGGMIRDRFQSDQVDRNGPLEVGDPARGFRITRPNAAWGVARGKTAAEWNPDAELVLSRLGLAAYIDVQELEPGDKTLVELREEEVRQYKADYSRHHNVVGSRSVLESEKRQLTDDQGRRTAEVRLQIRNKNQTTVREEIRQAFDSFRFDPP